MKMESQEISTTQGKRKHLLNSERFPRVFKEASRVLKKIKNEKIGVKTAVYSSKLKGRCFHKLYGLTHNVLKNLHIIDAIIEEVDLLHKEPHLDLEATEIMISELILKKNTLPGKSKPVLIIQKYEDSMTKSFLKHKSQKNDDHLFIPRYVRIHTLVTTVPAVLSWFKTNGYTQKYLSEDTSFSDFLDAVKQLNNGEFLQDFHFPEILVFAPNENLNRTALYAKGHIFLQDKASYIPVFALAPPLESNVLDCCAAPGMKTAHLACTLNNTGKIVALDRDAKRFSTLKDILNCGNITNCKAIKADFTQINPNIEPYSSIEYILLDPSCSGSGMIKRIDTQSSDQFSNCPERLEKLSQFQIMLLRHTLRFPNVKKIVYSTCSVHEIENEHVINEALKGLKNTFRVINAFPEWPMRGLETYSFGKFCVRASPKLHLTNGFFVAVIERDISTACSGQPQTENSSCTYEINDKIDCTTEKQKHSKKKKRLHNNKEFCTSLKSDNLPMQSGDACDNNKLHSKEIKTSKKKKLHSSNKEIPNYNHEQESFSDNILNIKHLPIQSEELIDETFQLHHSESKKNKRKRKLQEAFITNSELKLSISNNNFLNENDFLVQSKELIDNSHQQYSVATKKKKKKKSHLIKETPIKYP